MGLSCCVFSLVWQDVVVKFVRVRDVELYPDAGFAERVWDDDADWGALAKSARRVSERYSELLAGSSVLLRSSLVRCRIGA